jgi:hypothetical protein
MAMIVELSRFIIARKKFVLIPLIVVLIIFGGLLLLAQNSAVAPFIYTVF